MNIGNKIKSCLLCSSKKLYKKLEIKGGTPLANEFSEYKDYIEDDKFELIINYCSNCEHVQLSAEINPERLFKDYLYSAGKNSFEYFDKYSRNMIEKFNPKKILDIGSNNGDLLKCFITNNSNLIIKGVDPAQNLAKEAIKNKIPTDIEFFNSEYANKQNIKYDLILCNNMFAHNANLESIILGVFKLLDENGVFVFENSYLLDILDKNLIDVFYHEHIHTHSLKPLAKFFRNFGMKIFDVERLPNQHGGSIRVFVCKNSDNRTVSNNVFDLFEKEKNILYKLNLLQEKANILSKNLKSCLEKFKYKTIDCFGYPAKTTTLFYLLNIQKNYIRYCYEDSELKVGKFSPGLHIPIKSTAELLDNNPDVIIISAWNYSKQIIKNNISYINNGGTFLIPLPEIKIINKNNINGYLNENK